MKSCVTNRHWNLLHYCYLSSFSNSCSSMMSLKWNFPSYYEWFKLYYYTNDKVHSDIMGNEPYRAIIRSLQDLHYCSDLYFNQIANRTHFICCVVTIYIWYTYYIQHIKLKLKLKLLSSNVFLNNNLVRLSSSIHYMPTFFPTCSCFD